MQALLMIFIGGGAGCLCRYALSVYLSSSNGFPWATFAANMVACVVLGAIVGYEHRLGISPTAKLMLATGFCGGFSTFSTFSLETLKMVQAGQTLAAGTYIFASVFVGMLAVYSGYKMMYGGI